MKEIKVRIYRSEDDNYVELWKVIDPEKGKPQYYGRYMYLNEGLWIYVSDPLGYCERDHDVPNDVVFILCDEKGNECCRYSNADENPLPTLEEVIKAEWNKVKGSILHNTEDYDKDFISEVKSGETTLNINQWLLSFKDPDIYKEAIEGMNGYDENWLYGTRSGKEIKYEPIPGTTFSYLGHEYQFTKVTCKHDVCGVEWIEYKCTDSPCVIEEWNHRVKSYSNDVGNFFDAKNIGTMYDIQTARKIVKDALVEIYPPPTAQEELLHIRKNCCYTILDRISYEKAAEILLGSELHRNKVSELIVAEKLENHFFLYTTENKESILAENPGIIDNTWRISP